MRVFRDVARLPRNLGTRGRHDGGLSTLTARIDVCRRVAPHFGQMYSIVSVIPRSFVVTLLISITRLLCGHIASDGTPMSRFFVMRPTSVYSPRSNIGEGKKVCQSGFRLKSIF